MIILLYGPDTFRSRQKLEEIIKQQKSVQKKSLNLRRFFVEDIDFRDFQDEVRQMSIFREKKLIVLEGVFSDENFKDKFLESKDKFLESEDIIVFFEKEKILAKDPLLKFLIKKAKVQQFDFLEGEKLKNWLRKEFEKYNAEISPEAEKKLLDFIGNDLWQLSNEIQKLVNFKSGSSFNIVSAPAKNTGDKTTVDSKDVELLVKSKIETDIFQTIDAIAKKDKRKAFSLLHKHLEKGEKPFYLLSMISFQFRNLLIVKDLIEKNTPYYSITQKSRLHPFVVRKSFEQAGKFSLQELKKIYQKILEVDLHIKTGKVTQEVGLDLLISEV
ncbi:MAG: DNA polymerase III subunit delta [bacterium]|nr:DNA polymerase III subunit delta [bacterium]